VTAHQVSFIEAFAEDGTLLKVLMVGRAECISDLILNVGDRLQARRGWHGRYEVRTDKYRYHAWREVDGIPRDVLRYDNGHGSELHRHVFDEDGREVRREVLKDEEPPTIERVVREAIALTRG
jgi:hypothetical protein